MNMIEGIHYRTGRNIRIKTENGFISEIEEGGNGNLIVAPGLFDNQVNGYKGVGFSNPDLDVADICRVVNDLHEVGVTSFLPTIITAQKDILLRNMGIIREAIVETHDCVSHNTEPTPFSSTIPGIHLEGPFISPEPGFRGAHNPEWIRKPDLKEFDELFKASGEKIIHITLAPEIDGAIELIKHCRKLGVTVGLAHHNANAKQIDDAVDAGAGLAVHLGNGIANTIARHDNPIWPQLSNDGLLISMIADGFHLTREEIRTFYKVKGPGKSILTSDCTDLAGKSPGKYLWDGKNVVLEPEGVIRFPEQGVLAGAASPLIRDIGIMMKFTKCSLADAIDMASLNPARFHGITDRGEIKVGQRADLILFDLEDTGIVLKRTVKSG